MKALQKLLSMDDKAWQRHANPLSVWSRVITGMPLLLFGIWQLEPFTVQSILILCLIVFWLWLNPRLFPKPQNTENWASKVTLGERIWLNEPKSTIPRHHRQWALFLSIIAGIGFLIAAYGAYNQNIFLTTTGGITSWLGKMWFCDRMVWLFEDNKKVETYCGAHGSR